MTPLLLAATGAGIVTAAANGAAGGPDFVGIAAVIAAGASALATVIAAVITLLRFLRGDSDPKRDEIEDVIDHAVEKALKKRDRR